MAIDGEITLYMKGLRRGWLLVVSWTPFRLFRRGPSANECRHQEGWTPHVKLYAPDGRNMAGYHSGARVAGWAIHSVSEQEAKIANSYLHIDRTIQSWENTWARQRERSVRSDGSKLLSRVPPWLRFAKRLFSFGP